LVNQESELIRIVKTALMRMDKKFTDLSRLKFDEISRELKKKLEEQKLQERPFAYEFYHQLRKMYESQELDDIIPEGVVVQAEVHKGYQGIPNLNRMPDFLLHKPSSVNRNFAVIEFKLASYKDRLKDDFEKLAAFKEILGYTYLIEVIIGHDGNSLIECRKECQRLNSDRGIDIIIIEFNTETWSADHYKIKYLPVKSRKRKHLFLSESQPGSSCRRKIYP